MLGPSIHRDKYRTQIFKDLAPSVLPALWWERTARFMKSFCNKHTPFCSSFIKKLKRTLDLEQVTIYNCRAVDGWLGGGGGGGGGSNTILHNNLTRWAGSHFYSLSFCLKYVKKVWGGGGGGGMKHHTAHHMSRKPFLLSNGVGGEKKKKNQTPCHTLTWPDEQGAIFTLKWGGGGKKEKKSNTMSHTNLTRWAGGHFYSQMGWGGKKKKNQTPCHTLTWPDEQGAIFTL